MLLTISPAKTLDYDSPLATERHTQPELLAQSEALMETCRKLTPADIGSLMHISDKLAGLNAARFGSGSRISRRTMPVRLFWHLKGMCIRDAGGNLQ